MYAIRLRMYAEMNSINECFKTVFTCCPTYLKNIDGNYEDYKIRLQKCESDNNL
jgi:hypothetical protein